VRDLYNRIFGGLGLVIGIIVVFVITNAMAMAVIERTREVGTLRALGTLPQQLVGCFALEGLLLGGVGAVLGATLTGLITLALLWLPIEMPPPPGRSSGYPLQIAFDGTLYGATLLAVLVISAVASAAVARRAVNRPIVDALMHT
jgi:putative ABC transport system permease protein